MKSFFALLLLGSMGMTGCAKKDASNTTTLANALPAVTESSVLPQKTHWVARKYWNGLDWQLTCDESSKVIAGASNGHVLSNDLWFVYGGDGGGYGEYADEHSAKIKAETLSSEIWTGSLNKCP